MKVLVLLLALLSSERASSFRSIEVTRPHDVSLGIHHGDRRSFLHDVAAVSLGTFPAISVASSSLAVDEDLTTKLFNDDGSLKDESTDVEAKFRKLELLWDASDSFSIAIDGENAGNTQKGSAVRISYDLPEKWNTSSKQYIDKAEGARTCDRITVYQAEGKATMKLLEKATIKGIGESLRVRDSLNTIRQADLIGGRSRMNNDQKYYEFDMAIAPTSCPSSKEDLGLGFCPYESIYLLSSTVFNDRLYVFVLESDKAEWKFANSDLRRVRSSFSVDEIMMPTDTKLSDTV